MVILSCRLVTDLTMSLEILMLKNSRIGECLGNRDPKRKCSLIGVFSFVRVIIRAY